MTPTRSSIASTTGAGLGYGMLALLPIGMLIGLVPENRVFGLATLFLALVVLAVSHATLIAPIRHRSRLRLILTQWRSSWLSRQGVFGLATISLALLSSIILLFFGAKLLFLLTGLAMATMGLLTVYANGMVFASLPPIAAWHHPLTAPVFVSFALATGALALHFLTALFGLKTAGLGLTALIVTAGAFGLKIMRWQSDTMILGEPTLARATGLSELGRVRVLEAPPIQRHYLLQDEIFDITRRRAAYIKVMVYLVGLAGSLASTILALLIDGWLVIPVTFLALACGITGVLLERRLFFAEAEHTAHLYHGNEMTERVTTPSTLALPSTSAKSLAPKTKSAPIVQKQESSDTRRRPSRPQRRRTSATTSGNSQG